MNRRSMLGAAIGALVAAFIPRAWARAPALAAGEFGVLTFYPPFVRDGLLMTPTWSYRKVGERAYNVTLGDFYVCQRDHWELGTRMEPTCAPDSGMSPRERGYLDTPWAKAQFDDATWVADGPAPGWERGFGFEPSPEPQWVKGLLA